ncbi:MAG: lysylphosphatidylglycerol synthase transmembrane domain-containing protein [Ignavibacteriaceae bacterium]|nr:lysylphosphatidylglycerol synthase transmembrane domain-containing protein [Ignavibacteriaceae bacterium]
MPDVVLHKIIFVFSGRYKGLLLNIIKIAIAAGLLLYIILKVNFADILAALRNANITLIAVTVLLAFINIYLQFLKWKITCVYLLDEKSNKKVLLSLFYGFSGGVFTPARIGEYFGRAAAFKDKPVIKIAVATFIDKFFPLMAVTGFGSMASILFMHYYYNVSVYLTGSLFIVTFILFYAAYVIVLDPRFWDSVLFNRISKSPRIKKIFDNLMVLKELDRHYTTQMVFISIAFYTCFILQFALLAAAFSGHFNFIHYIWAGNLVMFAKTIIPPVSLGELGIREGASVFFLHIFGEPNSAGFNASIFLFLINMLIPSVIGLFLLLKRNND